MDHQAFCKSIPWPDERCKKKNKAALKASIDFNKGSLKILFFRDLKLSLQLRDSERHLCEQPFWRRLLQK